MSDSVVLKALRFYQAKVQKDFDEIAALFGGDLDVELSEIRKEECAIMTKAHVLDSDVERLSVLSAKWSEIMRRREKHLFDHKSMDSHRELRFELNELSAEIAKEERSERVV